MKKYSSKKAKKGKLAYRTPSRFINKKVLEKHKNKNPSSIPPRRELRGK